jgi:hypothetical protein
MATRPGRPLSGAFNAFLIKVKATELSVPPVGAEAPDREESARRASGEGELSVRVLDLI